MSNVRDIALAPSGHRKIDWVRNFMPALSQIEARFIKEQPFAGMVLRLIREKGVWRVALSQLTGREALE